MTPRRLLAIGVLMLSCARALAAPAHIEEAVPQARLAGAGIFTYFSMKIYSAELWVGPQGYGAGAPFALELRYARRLNGRKIAEASADQIEKTGAGSAAQRAAWLRTMTAIFPDVAEGTRLTGVYAAGRGARFYLDGKALASVDDPEFASAFFGIWLSPATTAPALRQALLKHAAPQ